MKPLYFAFWVVLVVFFSSVLVMQLNTYFELQKETSRIMAEIEQQQEINNALQREIDYYDSDFYVEKIARERLGLVKPDETVFIDDEKK